MQETQETRFDPRVRKIPWSRKGQPTPVFLPQEVHGQRSLAGYNPRARRESDTTKRLGVCVCPPQTHTHTCLFLAFRWESQKYFLTSIFVHELFWNLCCQLLLLCYKVNKLCNRWKKLKNSLHPGNTESFPGKQFSRFLCNLFPNPFHFTSTLLLSSDL